MFASYGYGTSISQLSSARFSIDVEDIPAYGCHKLLWYNKTLVNGPKFTNLKSIGDHGLEYAFDNCSSLSSVEIPSTPISVGSYGCNYAFSESGIKTVDNLSLSGIGAYGCSYMFSNCSALTSVNDLYLYGSALSSTNVANNRCTRMF